MSRLLKDPLLHFLAIGAVIFVLFAWLAEDEEQDPERIEISAEQVEEARRLAMMLRGRPPGPAEIEELLEPLIREQVLYREARALGLDRNDETVRLRLVEKMRFLAEDLAEPDPPAEEQLEAFFAADPELFALPARVSFEQIYFSPRERGEQLDADVDAALATLRAGGAAAGDRSPLRDRYSDAPYAQIEILFGEALADAMFSAEPGRWEGPFQSDFGVHLARLVDRNESRQPEFEEVRDTVLEAYLAERRREANEAEYRRMRERYEIVVDWPASAPEP